MSLINYIKKNIRIIKNKIGNSPEKGLNFNLVYKNPDEYLAFEFIGSGSFGNIFKITNNTKNKNDLPIGKSISIKILKTPIDETMKLKLLQDTIKKKCKNKYIMNKYIVKIINVDLKKQLIFMEYVEGETLESYIRNNNVLKNDMYLVYIRTLLSIKAFHNVLKFSHRDLKPLNILYDKNSKILKCIDFGFICQFEDRNCKNRHQGTSKYIHADMNKKYTKYKRRQKVNFPDSISQDLFSTIITLFKMYLHASKQKGGNNFFNKNLTKKIPNNPLQQPINPLQQPINPLQQPINPLQQPINPLQQSVNALQQPSNRIEVRMNKLNEKNKLKSKKNNNIFIKKKDIVLELIYNFENELRKSYNNDNRVEKEIRYKAKNNLFINIKNTNLDDVDDLIMKEIFKIIKKYWNFDLTTFSIDGKKSILISNFIFDTLVFNIFNILEPSAEKDLLFMDWSLIYAHSLNTIS